MMAFTPAAIAALKGYQLNLVHPLLVGPDDVEHVVGVRRGVATSGEVLRCGRDAAVLKPLSSATAYLAQVSGSSLKDRTPISGFLGLMFTSQTGEYICVTPISR